MSGLYQDIRLAFRLMLKRPAFTIVIVVTLALGIGANTAVFSIVNGVILKPLPFRDSDRLVMVWETSEKWITPFGAASYPNFADWRQECTVFESMGAYSRTIATLAELDPPEAVPCGHVTSDFFPTLGILAALGDLFRPADDEEGAEKVVVLSDKFWRSHMGADPNVLGRTVAINGTPHVVRGVLPAGLDCPVIGTDSELWTPQERQYMKQRGDHYLRVAARLKPEASLDQARTQLATVAGRLAKEYPGTNEGRGIRVATLRDESIGNVRSVLYILFGAVAVVLLIACANVANLLLARNAARGREYAVRAALGAGRAQLIRLLLTESLLLGMLGAGAGVLLAGWSIDALTTIMPADFPRLHDIGLDLQVLGFTAGVALLAVIVFGLAPALHVVGADIAGKIREHSGTTSAAPGRNRARAGLAVAQLALTLTLLIGAGLLIRSLHLATRIDPGFVPDNMLTFMMMTPPAQRVAPQQRAELYDRMLERLAGLPGVAGVAAGDSFPWSGAVVGRSFEIPNRAEPTGNEELYASFTSVSVDYFRVLGIPLLKGRFFDEPSIQAGRKVVLIDESAARQYWPDAGPVGQTIAFTSEMTGNRSCSYEILGVVGDVRSKKIDVAPEPHIYLPYKSSACSFMCFALRATGDPLALTGQVRSAAAEIAPNEPLHKVKTLDQYLDDALGPRRYPAQLLGILAFIAMATAAVGVYGVMSYSVEQRRREIGLRMALGAMRSNVLRLVLGQGMMLTLLGLAIGLALAIPGSRLLSGLLFEISAVDPLTILCVSGLLVAIALTACYIPARRAAKVDPLIALRCE